MVTHTRGPYLKVGKEREGMSDKDIKPLRGILKTGDESPRSKRHVGGISLHVEEGHDAEKKEHKVGWSLCGVGKG
jgi:hypothetical protein